MAHTGAQVTADQLEEEPVDALGGGDSVAVYQNEHVNYVAHADARTATSSGAAQATDLHDSSSAAKHTARNRAAATENSKGTQAGVSGVGVDGKPTAFASEASAKRIAEVSEAQLLPRQATWQTNPRWQMCLTQSQLGGSLWELYDRAALRTRGGKVPDTPAHSIAAPWVTKHGHRLHMCKMHMFLHRIGSYEPELLAIVRLALLQGT